MSITPSRAHEAEPASQAPNATIIQRPDAIVGHSFARHLLSLPEMIDIERDPAPLRHVDLQDNEEAKQAISPHVLAAQSDENQSGKLELFPALSC